MANQITINYHFEGARHISFLAPELKPTESNMSGRRVSNASTLLADLQPGEKPAEVKGAQPSPSEIKAKKTNLKRWVLIASWIIGMVTGLTLATTGACLANPLLTQLGTLVMTSFTGIGAKIVDHLLAEELD